MKQKEEMAVLEVRVPKQIKLTPQNQKYFKGVIDHLKENKEIVMDVDGFHYYIPKTTGTLSSSDLKVIAQYLDELNEPYEKQIEEYFQKEIEKQTKEKLDF